MDRRLAVHFDPLERLVLLDDPGHLGLDLREVGLRQGVLHLEIVIEALGHRRPEGQLHALEQPHDRPGHDVGAGMAQQIEGLGVFGGDQPQGDLAVGGQQIIDACHLPIHFGGQSGLGQTRADVGGDVDGPNATGILERFSVGKDDFEHKSPAGRKKAPRRLGASIQRTPHEFPAGGGLRGV